MNDELYLGIDLGTQSVKVGVFSRSGSVEAAASRRLTSRRDGPLHEQDPHEWISATADAVAESIGSMPAGRRASVAGIALCGTSGTLALVDARGRPVSTGIMYDDVRGGAFVDEITAADPDRWERLGYRIQPSWAITEMVHLARDGTADGARFAHQPDVVAADIVGGPVATDWSSALKSGYDLIDLEWPTAAFTTLGVDERMLPDVVAPGSVLGRTSPEWEAATGLPAGVPVIAGMTDGCASQLGAGALHEGDWHSVVGTTLVLKGVSGAPVRGGDGAVYSHRSPEAGRWLPGGASSVGADAISVLLPGRDLPDLAERAWAAWHAGELPVPSVYPLVRTGERFPFVRPDATGFAVIDGVETDLDGLGDDVSTYVGLLAGVACVEKLCLDSMAALGASVDGRLSSSGGGTRSPIWTQLRADLLARPVVIPRSAEPSLGMALLAAAATEGRSLPDVADDMSGIGHVVEPTGPGHERMMGVFAELSEHWRAKGWIG
jgi:sugar (pentulose or hexulose) kinase